MAVQIRQAVKRTLKPPRYLGREGFIQDMDEANAEMDHVKEIMNRTAMMNLKSIRSTQLVLDDAMDEEGYFKQKMTSKNIKEHGLKSENLYKPIRPFITNLAFNLTGGGLRCNWGAYVSAVPGFLGPAFIVWAGDESSVMMQETINQGSLFPMIAGTYTYFYIDTQLERGTYTVYRTTSITAAKDAGRVLLAQVRAGANYDKKISLWGGGTYIGT